MDKLLNVHSIESFATLEGEGIRYAVFLQGCPFRCVYCHNPDTWSELGASSQVATSTIVNRIARNKGFYKNGGGLTVSGGEPLLQSSSLIDLFRRVHDELGLTNTIDTSAAVMPRDIDELLEHTDLVIIDLKFHNADDYAKYVKGKMDNVLAMLDKTLAKGIKVWVRTVVVPTINDTIQDIDKYLKIIKRYPHIAKYELLGFHTMGSYKYAELGIDNPLDGVPALTAEKLIELKNHVSRNI